MMAGMNSTGSIRPLLAKFPSGVVGEILDQGVAAFNKIPHQKVALNGPMAILWDIENCPVPSDVNAEDVAGNIRMALRLHPTVKGVVTMFSAYGDFNHFSRKVREGCQRTGVNLIDVPNGKKDASDKAILVDMFLFALDNPPPCTILLISGDVDFAPALHKLGQRGYTMVLAIPAGVGVSSVLCNAGRFVWDWPSLARGDGLVPPKILSHRSADSRFADISACMLGSAWQSGDDSDLLTDDDRYVYNKHVNNNRNICVGCADAPQFSITAANISQCGGFPFDSSNLRVSQSPSQSGVPSSQVVASGSNFQANQVCSLPDTTTSFGNLLSASSNTCSQLDQLPGEIGPRDEMEPWVQPGDLQGLKGQLIRIVKLNGGKLPLLRMPSEYCKLFGRPLYLAEYGSPKLVHLIERMPDAFFIKGEGNKRTLHLKDNTRMHTKNRRARDHTCLSITQQDKLDEVVVQGMMDAVDYAEEIVLLQRQSVMVSDDEKASEGNEESDGANKAFECSNKEIEASEGDAYAAEVMLEVFKQEVQELLVSHACAIPLLSFGTLYKQRYARELDLTGFGVAELDLLFGKLGDVATVKVDKLNRKFLVANHHL